MTSILPTVLYKLANEYADNTKIYLAIPSINRDECISIVYLGSGNIDKYTVNDIVNIIFRRFPSAALVLRYIKNTCNEFNISKICIHNLNSALFDGLNKYGIRHLSISNCNIRITPQLDFPLLTVLFLKNSGIVSMPDLQLPSLRSLIIKENVRTIPDFNGMPLLKRLCISNNMLIETIPNFSHIPLLRILYIVDNNHIKKMPRFTHLPSLMYVLLNTEMIENLHSIESSDFQAYTFLCDHTDKYVRIVKIVNELEKELIDTFNDNIFIVRFKDEEYSALTTASGLISKPVCFRSTLYKIYKIINVPSIQAISTIT